MPVAKILVTGISIVRFRLPQENLQRSKVYYPITKTMGQGG